MNIFLPKDRGHARPYLLIRPALFILLLAVFFFYYNVFLIDRSIESLKYSLSNIAIADTTGSVSYIAPLVQFQFMSEISSVDFDLENMMSMEYAGDVLTSSSVGRSTDDVVSVMEYTIARKQLQRNRLLRFLDKINALFKNLFRKARVLFRKRAPEPKIKPAILEEINRYENNGKLDKAVSLYRETISKFSNYAETPGLTLRLGYLLHKMGNLKEAEEVYREALKKYPGLPETRGASELIGRLKKSSALKKKTGEMAVQATVEKDVKIRQELYYRMGLMEMSVLNLKRAKRNFTKALTLLPDTVIAEQSYFRLGLCERLIGNIDASIMAFNKVLGISKDPELKMYANYQIAQAYRQRDDYEKAISYLGKGLKDYKDKKVIPLLEFQIGSTYLFDLKDLAKTKEVFEGLRSKFPDRGLIYPGTDFVDKYIDMDVPAIMPEEITEYMKKSWLETALPRRFLNFVEQASVRFTTFITEGVTEIVLLEEYDVEEGDYVDIDLTQKRLNNYMERWFPPGNKTRVWDVSVKFKGNRKLEVFGSIYLPDGRKIKGNIDGVFRMLKGPPRPYWKEKDKKKKSKHKYFIAYYPKKSKIGGITMPQAVMNIVLKPSIKRFNKDFPLDIEVFKLDKDTILFGGPIREDLVLKLQAEAYGLRHMEVKDEESGFIYGRRKESLGASGLEKTKEPTRDTNIGGMNIEPLK